ncbi:MAG: fatty acid desaturase [Burkholderiales bacterium]|nr:fatty acid desaturase [Burkholderiales bacterium]
MADDKVEMVVGRVFKHSVWDATNAAVIPLQAASFVWLALAYPGLSLGTLLAMVPVVYVLALLNSGANHNHYHTPFFHARWLNAAARMGFSLVGAPKTPHNLYHGYHHATKKSWNEVSFLQVIGLRRPLHKQVLAILMFYPESFGFKYLVLFVLLKRWSVERLAKFATPDDTVMGVRLFKRIKEPAALRAAKLDVAVWVGFRVLLCVIDWQFFVFFFVPVTYVVETLRMGEDYMHHWGAVDPDDPRRDAVSCYGRVYNWISFNLGYHQEHHLRPGEHWLRLPAMSAELPIDRRTVPFTHYLNLPVFYPALATDLVARRGADAERPSARP